ncbi:MAG: GntR family transcriptional regulator [Rubrivivax sp.]|nr:GntR family transcriptional regulator [Rubrivivax sp.]MCL4697337.1 GntR family transcriptional regulator [Burkholderiaceae bacterium]
MISKDEIAQRVVDSILSQKLGPGERLGEQELAALFGVSRTVVREALIQLQARGFVQVRARSGWYVVEPSFEDAQETYASRRVIEPGMLHGAGRPLQSVIRRLRQHVDDERRAIERADAGTRAVLPADFHVCLAQCVGNRFLTSVMVELSARTTLASALHQTREEAQVSNDDHAAIVDALAEGDSARAEHLLRQYIDTIAARLDQRLAGNGDARQRIREALLAERPARAKGRSRRAP